MKLQVKSIKIGENDLKVVIGIEYGVLLLVSMWFQFTINFKWNLKCRIDKTAWEVTQTLLVMCERCADQFNSSSWTCTLQDLQCKCTSIIANVNKIELNVYFCYKISISVAHFIERFERLRIFSFGHIYSSFTFFFLNFFVFLSF